MKGSLQRIIRPNLIHSPCAENSDIEKDDVLKDAPHARDIMVHDEGRFSDCGECAQMIDEPSLGFIIYAREGFIQEKNLGRLRECAGEKRPLPLAAGKVRKWSLGKVMKPDEVQKGLDMCASFISAREGKRRKKFCAARKTHRHDVRHGHGEVEVDVIALRDVSHGRFSGLKRSTENLAGATRCALKSEYRPKER